MKFLVLLISFALERYLHIGNMGRRFGWMPAYLAKINKHYAKTPEKLKGARGVIIAILPMVAIVAIVYFGVVLNSYSPFRGLGLDLVVFVYCLGPDTLFHPALLYIENKKAGNEDRSVIEYERVTEEKEDADSVIAGKKFTQAVFIKGNEYFLAIMFWYILFGAVGALIYRLIYVLANLAAQHDSSVELFGEKAMDWNEKLHWIPSRVTGLLLVAGRGPKAWKTWTANAFTAMGSRAFLLQCGQEAVNEGGVLQLDPISENEQALKLVDRAIHILLGCMVVYSILIWF